MATVTRPSREIRNTQLHISLPAELDAELRDLAWQKRQYVSHLCREFIQAGLKKMKEEDAVESMATEN